MLLIRDIPLVNSEINPGMAVGIPRNQLRRRSRSDWIRVMKRMTRDIKKRGKWPFLRTQFPIVPDETPIRSASHNTSVHPYDQTWKWFIGNTRTPVIQVHSYDQTPITGRNQELIPGVDQDEREEKGKRRSDLRIEPGIYLKIRK